MPDFSRKSPLDRLDNLAHATRLPDFFRRLNRPRRLLWLPVAALALATIVCLRELIWPGIDWVVYGLGASAYTLVIVCAALGPLREGSGADERERALARDAWLVTFASVCIAALFGALLLMILTLLENRSRDALLEGLGAVFMYGFTLFIGVPPLYASWKMPEEADGEE